MSNRICRAALGALLFAGTASWVEATPNAVGLSCQVVAAGKAQVDVGNACAAFKSALNASLGRSVVIVPDRAHSPSGDWVQVKITNPRRNAVQADFAGSIGTRRLGNGPIIVEVIDKALGRNEVDKLAKAVAKAIASR